MNDTTRLLQIYSPGEARAIYRMVMEVRFGLSQTDLLLGKDKELSAHDLEEKEKIIKRLLSGEPVQYVLGQATFCGRIFSVAPGVLIPRPETEELAELVLSTLTSSSRICDIGTGSGCLAITFALEGHSVTAMDLSEKALRQAKGNAEKLGAKVDFRLEDILHPSDSNEHWDALVSNPPYICLSESKEMEKNVLEYEPHEALFVPDEDPLLFYRSIAAYGRKYLREGGYLFFEINRAYGSQIQNLLKEYNYQGITLRKDQFGNPRMIEAKR